MNNYLVAVLFFLPAGIGNMAPVIANKIPILNRWNAPLDFGKDWKGKRILGDNKRWRGVVFGTLLAGLSAMLISTLQNDVVYSAHPFILGCALGFGALFGDGVESFFKRLKGLKPGQSWFPFDQLDYIVGGLLFVYPFARLPINDMVTMIIVDFCIHLVSAY